MHTVDGESVFKRRGHNCQRIKNPFGTTGLSPGHTMLNETSETQDENAARSHLGEESKLSGNPRQRVAGGAQVGRLGTWGDVGQTYRVAVTQEE